MIKKRRRKALIKNVNGLYICPFCGSEKVKLISPRIYCSKTNTIENKYTVVCVDCETGISQFDLQLYSDYKEAINAWNRRYNPDEDDGK